MARAIHLDFSRLGTAFRELGAMRGTARRQRIMDTISALLTTAVLPVDGLDRPREIDGRTAWARRVPNDGVSVVWHLMVNGEIHVIAVVRNERL